MTSPDLSETRTFYETIADSYAALVSGIRFESSVELALVADFAAMLAESGRQDVLDAGCGTGRMVGHLQSLFRTVRVSGVDLSPAMLAHARAAHPDAEFREAALQDMPFADASFDGILAWYSIIHTAPAQLARVFDEFRRVARPGALVLLGFQAGTGERRRPGAYGHDIELHAHLHDTDTVSATLVRAGFIVDVRLDRGPRLQEKLAQGFVLGRAV